MISRQTLPLLWLLSDVRNDMRLEAALRSLPRGSGFVFRHYHLDATARRERFEALARLARELGHLVILAGDQKWGADGTYGKTSPVGPGLQLATAHDEAQIRAAAESGANAIFLSPVFPTYSHAGAHSLGIERFHVLAQRSSVPVIALGGMTHERARELDWPRWGAIDGLTSTKSA